MSLAGMPNHQPRIMAQNISHAFNRGARFFRLEILRGAQLPAFNIQGKYMPIDWWGCLINKCLVALSVT